MRGPERRAYPASGGRAGAHTRPRAGGAFRKTLRQAGEEAAADRRRILDEAQSRRDEGLRSARAEGEAIRRAAEEEAASACRELTERAMARRDAVIRLAAERLLADDA